MAAVSVLVDCLSAEDLQWCAQASWSTVCLKPAERGRRRQRRRKKRERALQVWVAHWPPFDLTVTYEEIITQRVEWESIQELGRKSAVKQLSLFDSYARL